MLRIALIGVLLCLTTLRVEAYPAVDSCTFSWSEGAGSFSTLAGAVGQMEAGTGGTLAGYCSNNSFAGCVSRGPPVCQAGGDFAFAKLGASMGGGISASAPSGSYTCPGGGTLSGSTCTCGPGETDNGSACIPNPCPAAGSPMGYHNLTVGWTLSPTQGANDYVGGYGTGIIGATHCVPNGGDQCGATVDAPGGSIVPQNCWRSQAPADGSGLYRVSCDFAMVSGGSGCTPSGTNPSNPTSPPPACPTGNVGEVNGKSVCLGTVPTSGINLGAPDQAGNPRAGSGAEQTNTDREPTGGAGGGPDARGGPGVTTGPNGSVGTGGNRTPGSGKNGEAPKLELPTDYNREPTQQSILGELKKARKIDETGTPDGKGADTDAKATGTTEYGKLQTGLEGIIAGSGAPDRSWGFSISFPSTCNPFVVGTANWGFFNVDFCDFQDVAHDLMTLVWLGVTIFACVGMVFRAINAG